MDILYAGNYARFRRLCHQVKVPSAETLRQAANILVPLLEGYTDAVIVPMPSSCGKATDTLSLALELSRLRNISVLDILEGAPRAPLYRLKLEGRQPHDASFFGFRLKAQPPEGARILLLDNVIATGRTMRAAMETLPKAAGLCLAADIEMMRQI